jgi:hypothetical protein
MTPLTVAATLLGMSELALAGDGAVDAARPYPGDNGASQVLLKKMEAMEQRIKSLESQLKQKDAPPAAQKTPAAISDGKPRGKANRTLDLAAAPAGDLVADAPLPSQTAAPAQTAAPGQTAAPDQADKSAKSAKAAKPDTLEKAGDKAILGLTDSPIPGLAIGAYGEMLFGAAQNPAAGGQWQGGADIRRMVLLPTYAITDNIIFNAELEWEHGGFSPDGDDKVNGEIDVEQLWIDFKDRRSVQLAGAGNRPRSDRLHQPASRADAVLQRAAAGNIQRPHPFDLDGPVEQRLRLDRRRTGLSDHGVEQH